MIWKKIHSHLEQHSVFDYQMCEKKLDWVINSLLCLTNVRTLIPLAVNMSSSDFLRER